jgi:hypothetical protein
LIASCGRVVQRVPARAFDEGLARGNLADLRRDANPHALVRQERY